MNLYRFKQFLRLIEETDGVHHDMTIMRGNPLHQGHEDVIKQVKDSATKHRGGHTILLTKTHDPKKNPLSPEQKLHYAKKAFPDANVKLTTKESPTLLHQASDLHKAGVNHLHIHVGSDRASDFHKLLHTYNGTHGPHGHYNFKSIHVHPVGEERDNADPQSSKVGDKTTYSASAMRSAAASGDRRRFHEMAPSRLTTSEKDSMYHDTINGMNKKAK